MKKMMFTLLLAVIGSMAVSAAQPKIWLLGDGTMAEWGRAFSEHIGNVVEVRNIAQDGLSVKALEEKGGLDSVIIGKVKKDFLMVQLGQNDLNETNVDTYSSLKAFTQELVELVHAVQEKKMVVILCTPLAHPYYNDGVLVNRLGGYAEAVRRVAVSMNVPVIDLEQLSHDWMVNLSEEGVVAYYQNLNTEERPVGEYLLNEEGALQIAQMVESSLRQLGNKQLIKALGQ